MGRIRREDIDYSVYLVTDRRLSRGRSTVDVVTAAVRGGATVVQLREKTADTREFIEEAMAMQDFLAARGVPLIINDRIDVALAVNADGVHLGQRDMPIELARKIVGPQMIIGISAESLADAVAAERAGADYLGVSPIFDTSTKTDTAPALGLEGLKQIRTTVNLPLVGIGGLNADNAGRVIENGADGVAVVSAIVSADDPEPAARELFGIVASAKAVM
jgi:thiamine-phosphate pyrophosphorylase